MGSAEQYAMNICNHYLDKYSHVTGCSVQVIETLWQRMNIDGKQHSHAFTKPSVEEKVVNCFLSRSNGLKLQSGLRNLIVLKTTGSGFVNFHKDDLTTLPEISDRILATNITAIWTYRKNANVNNYAEISTGIREIICKLFATTYSDSVQATLWDISKQVIQQYNEIEDISFDLPNLHHWEIDFTRFSDLGLTNNNDIFVAVDEPHGTIRGTIRR